MSNRKRSKITHGSLFFVTILFCVSQISHAEETKNALATVGGRTITETEIAPRIEGQMKRINTQIFQVKKQALDALIADELLEQEAKKRGLTRDQLLQQEVYSKVAAVSDAEAERVYNENKNRLGKKTFAEVKAQIIQELQTQRRLQQQQNFVRTLRKAASVKILLKPPLVNLALDGAPVRGPVTAPVTIVEFSDYQ
jgi:hypothetical protein